jgi:mono/diheme cytochrome c family protein
MRGGFMKILLSVLMTLAILLSFFLIYIYSGWHNVSAMNEESGLMKWIFSTTKNNSVESRIKDISVPDLKNSSMIKEGFEHYKEMCESCHGAPGIEETELSKGLNPPAPYLVDEAKEVDPRKLFWITKYGIKMTGMPAWGKTHSDESIWAIVSFMRTMSDMTAEDYKKMGSETVLENKNQEQSGESEHQRHSHNKGEHHH